MNDFPMPEDPPVRMTDENGWSASLSEGTTHGGGIGGRLQQPFSANRAARTLSGRAFARHHATQSTSKIMNHQNPHELIVSGIHLDLTPSLKTYVREKAERLFRHGERIIRIRVELECDRNPAGRQFKAKGHISINGPDMNATVASDDCHTAISLLIDKLDRMLSRRHQLLRVKRHSLHAVELEAEIPKVG
jgi:putative sigma-54 modulation protein